MRQQQNDSTETLKKASIQNLAKVTKSQPGRRRERKYLNVCIACRIPNTKKLIIIRRAGGRDLHLCRKHAIAWLGEL